jgi:hypothetical protein
MILYQKARGNVSLATRRMPRRRKMGETKLSQTLLDLGFFSALGTTEICGGTSSLVGRGMKNTFDYNNGVYVCYDEDGRPWIVSAGNDVATNGLRKIIASNKTQRGAPVPHSNDGGYFIREVLPNL